MIVERRVICGCERAEMLESSCRVSPPISITNGDVSVGGTDPKNGTLEFRSSLDFGYMRVEAVGFHNYHEAADGDEPLFGSHVHEAYKVFRDWIRQGKR